MEDRHVLVSIDISDSILHEICRQGLDLELDITRKQQEIKFLPRTKGEFMRDDDFCQMNLFNIGREYKKITKTPRLIELFSGVGCQARSLKALGIPFEHWKTCEWAAPSIKAYNAVHMKDWTDYSKDLTKEQLIQFLDGNISTNYNEPCDVRKQSEKWLREVYNNCIATHNLMNIQNVKGGDLEVKDTDKYEYILTYSFPCQ